MAISEEVHEPKQLPSEKHLVIVKLEAIHVKAPGTLNLGSLTYEIVSYHYTTVKDDVAARLRHASVVITTTVPINAKTLGEAKHL
jgi:hypothetical protein